jgi:hypothetical protein
MPVLPKAFCGRFIAVDGPPASGASPHVPSALAWVVARVCRCDPRRLQSVAKRQSFTRHPPPQGRVWKRRATCPNKAELAAISRCADGGLCGLCCLTDGRFSTHRKNQRPVPRVDDTGRGSEFCSLHCEPVSGSIHLGKCRFSLNTAVIAPKTSRDSLPAFVLRSFPALTQISTLCRLHGIGNAIGTIDTVVFPPFGRMGDFS